MTGSGPPGRQHLRRRLLVGVALALVGVAGFVFWQMRIESRVGEIGPHLLSTEAGQGLVDGGIPEEVIRDWAHCASGTLVQECSLYLIPHSTPATLRVDVKSMRSLGGRWEGSVGTLQLGDRRYVAVSRDEDWGSISGDADYSDVIVWIEAEEVLLDAGLNHQYVTGEASVEVEGAEHGQRANTYETFDRTVTRDLTLFVITSEERDLLVGTAVPPLVSAAIALASIFAAYAGVSLAWVSRRKLRNLRTEEQTSPTP